MTAFCGREMLCVHHFCDPLCHFLIIDSLTVSAGCWSALLQMMVIDKAREIRSGELSYCTTLHCWREHVPHMQTVMEMYNLFFSFFFVYQHFFVYQIDFSLYRIIPQLKDKVFSVTEVLLLPNGCPWDTLLPTCGLLPTGPTTQQ